MPNPQTMTPPEVAHRLTVPLSRVMRLLFLGRLRGEKAENGRWQIDVASVDKYDRERLDSHAAESRAATA